MPGAYGRASRSGRRSRSGSRTTRTRSEPRPRRTTLAHADAALRRGWHSLLGRYPWAWYCHFTFAHSNRSGGAWNEFAAFERRLARASEVPPPWFALLDASPTDRLHFHVLLGPLGALRADEIEMLWWGGKERSVEAFDTTRRGLSYLTKKISVCDAADEKIEFDFHPKLDRAFTRAVARSEGAELAVLRHSPWHSSGENGVVTR